MEFYMTTIDDGHNTQHTRKSCLYAQEGVV